MKEKELIKNLKNLKVEPSKSWQQSFYKSIEHIEDVTIEEKSRNSTLVIFKFLPNLSMKVNLKPAAIVAGAVLVVLLAGGGTVYAANQAGPGDFLYGVDKATESVQRALTFDAVKKTELELSIMDERVAELQTATEANDPEAISEALTNIDEQKLMLQDRLQVMDQLRTEDKLQTQEQQKVMEQLQTKLQEQTGTMNQIQNQLKTNGDNSNATELEKVQNQYKNEMDTEVQKFEENTGIQIKESESEQNAGEDTQIQNQNQNETQNQGEDSNGQQQGGSGTQQQGGSQGKNN